MSWVILLSTHKATSYSPKSLWFRGHPFSFLFPCFFPQERILFMIPEYLINSVGTRREVLYHFLVGSDVKGSLGLVRSAGMEMTSGWSYHRWQTGMEPVPEDLCNKPLPLSNPFVIPLLSCISSACCVTVFLLFPSWQLCPPHDGRASVSSADRACPWQALVCLLDGCC